MDACLFSGFIKTYITVSRELSKGIFLSKYTDGIRLGALAGLSIAIATCASVLIDNLGIARFIFGFIMGRNNSLEYCALIGLLGFLACLGYLVVRRAQKVPRSHEESLQIAAVAGMVAGSIGGVAMFSALLATVMIDLPLLRSGNQDLVFPATMFSYGVVISALGGGVASMTGGLLFLMQKVSKGPV